MKKACAIICCMLFILSCKKEKNVMTSDFAGRWEYRGFYGFEGNQPQTPGNGNIILLTPNRVFKRWENHSVAYQGLYSIKKQTNCTSSTDMQITTTDPQFLNGHTISKNGDSLFISTPSCYADGGTAIYVKINYQEPEPHQ